MGMVLRINVIINPLKNDPRKMKSKNKMCHLANNELPDSEI